MTEEKRRKQLNIMSDDWGKIRLPLPRDVKSILKQAKLYPAITWSPVGHDRSGKGWNYSVMQHEVIWDDVLVGENYKTFKQCLAEMIKDIRDMNQRGMLYYNPDNPEERKVFKTR